MNQLDADLLLRVFENLTVQELVSSPLLVCKKWKACVLDGNHRRVPADVFQCFLKPESISPLQIYNIVYESNLLQYAEMNLDGFMKHALLAEGKWMTTVAGRMYNDNEGIFVLGGRPSGSRPDSCGITLILVFH